MAAENTYDGLGMVTARRLNRYHEEAVVPIKEAAEATASAVANLGFVGEDGMLYVMVDDDYEYEFD